MIKILGVVWHGSENSRVLFLRNGILCSARVPNRFLAQHSFPVGVETGARAATESDKTHALYLFVVLEPVRVCRDHARVNGTIYNQPVSARVNSMDAIPGRNLEIEQRAVR
jgi:hypothetical protein